MPVTAGLAPRVEVISKTSSRVNRERARQCPSVAVDAQRPDDTVISVFVHLDADLDDTSREIASAALAARCRRVRWKSNAAMVEVSTAVVSELAGIPGVGYVENGLSLSAPNPTGSRPGRAPDLNMRRVTTCREQHKDGQDVLVGIIDVGGFDFAHPISWTTTATPAWKRSGIRRGTTRPPPRYASAATNATSTTARDPQTAHGCRHRCRCGAQRWPPRASSPSRRWCRDRTAPTSPRSPRATGESRARRASPACWSTRRPDAPWPASSFYDSTRIADAVDYLLDLAAELGEGGPPLPVSINISLGTNGHAHDTSSAMARNGSTTRCRPAAGASRSPPATPARSSRRPPTTEASSGPHPRRRRACRHRPAPRPRLGRRRRRAHLGRLRERDGDLVRPAGPVRRRGPASRRRLERPDHARPEDPQRASRQRDRV